MENVGKFFFFMYENFMMSFNGNFFCLSFYLTRNLMKMVKLWIISVKEFTQAQHALNYKTKPVCMKFSNSSPFLALFKRLYLLSFSTFSIGPSPICSYMHVFRNICDCMESKKQRKLFQCHTFKM